MIESLIVNENVVDKNVVNENVIDENVTDENVTVENVLVDTLDDILGASEELDISLETDSDGRRVLPSRPEASSVPSPTISPSSPTEENLPSLQDSSSSPLPNRKRKSLVSSLLPEPQSKRSRQDSPNNEDDQASTLDGCTNNKRILRSDDVPPSTWTRGRGKGGRNMRILRNKITNQNKNDQQNVKILWKQWVKGYVEEINEIIVDNPQGLHIVCADCGKNVSKQSYL